MRKLPILFNTEMVRAILDGRKTQTRRVIKPQPTNPRWNNVGWLGWDDGHGYRMKAPCAIDDVLWVRETWDNIPVSPGGHMRMGGKFYYKADGDIRPDGWQGNWHPSIHMPREAARIFLRVKDVRVERLRDMNDSDLANEGFGDWIRFISLWNSTIKLADCDKYDWNTNPWVWVIEFNIEHIEGRKWVEAP